MHSVFIQIPHQCYSDTHRQSVFIQMPTGSQYPLCSFFLVLVGYAVMLKMLLLQVFPQIDEVMVKPLRLSKDRYEEMKNKEDAARES